MAEGSLGGSGEIAVLQSGCNFPSVRGLHRGNVAMDGAWPAQLGSQLGCEFTLRENNLKEGKECQIALCSPASS